MQNSCIDINYFHDSFILWSTGAPGGVFASLPHQGMLAAPAGLFTVLPGGQLPMLSMLPPRFRWSPVWLLQHPWRKRRELQCSFFSAFTKETRTRSRYMFFILVCCSFNNKQFRFKLAFRRWRLRDTTFELDTFLEALSFFSRCKEYSKFVHWN